MTAEDRPQIAATEKSMGRGRRIPYSGQFVTLNFILPMRWRRAALCLKGIKVTDRLLRLPIAYTTTAKRSVHQRGGHAIGLRPWMPKQSWSSAHALLNLILDPKKPM
ncbi:hypothetical protein U8C33_37815 (plasmid) [Sinorhizobium meliloti]|nr:hypothetical protein U8C33_37815 [Sinorhizobium meliloti]